jgi:NAD(P)H-dependent FMN reductase
MKVLAIVASGNRNGNVSKLCKKITEGAQSAGNEVEIINLYDYKVNPCTGCLGCTRTRKCVQKDDFEALFNKEKEADYIIIGSPIYGHSVTGILKNFIDRSCHATIPFVQIPTDAGLFAKLGLAKEYLNGFKMNAPFKGKKFITVLACNNPSKTSSDMKAASLVLKKFIDEMGGTLFGSIRCADTLFRLNPKSLEKAYQQAYRVGIRIR